MGLTFLLGFLLCIFQSSESILVKVANNRPDPHPSSAKLLSSNRDILGGHQPIPLEDEEDQKWRHKRLLNNNGDVNEDDEDDEQETRNDIETGSTSSSSSCDIPPILLFAVPGAIYFFNNNLTFILLSLMPAPTYVVLSNLKILTTGLFSFLFLHRILTTVQWVSLGILFLSTAVSQVDLEKGLSLSISIQAFLLMILFCSLSAAASVFSEYVMKERFAKESIHLQNMKLYMFGILFNGITFLLTPVATTTDPAQQSGFFSDMVPIHFFIIMAYASLGLVTSAIIKFSGSITKVYASSMSMFFAALVSWLLLNESVTALFFVGCFGCCYALHLYYRVPADSAPDASASAESHGRVANGAERVSTSSATSSTTLAATSPGPNHNQKSVALMSVKVVDQNEYLSLDTMDDQEENQQQHHNTIERR
ncbi:hypothetical protein BGZ51_003456 [Haplosporangium sp. Z 767]|nr:hypothetical protein BGZ51_003456 [Haplosporangium sp. Z 767]